MDDWKLAGRYNNSVKSGKRKGWTDRGTVFDRLYTHRFTVSISSSSSSAPLVSLRVQLHPTSQHNIHSGVGVRLKVGDKYWEDWRGGVWGGALLLSYITAKSGGLSPSPESGGRIPLPPPTPCSDAYAYSRQWYYIALPQLGVWGLAPEKNNFALKIMQFWASFGTSFLYYSRKWGIIPPVLKVGDLSRQCWIVNYNDNYN